MPDLSRVYDLHHGSQQFQILNPLSEARDSTHILMDPSRVRQLLSHEGNSGMPVILKIGSITAYLYANEKGLLGHEKPIGRERE